jgi:hypothetical protein
LHQVGGRYYAAWILNLNAIAMGLVIAPNKAFRAFIRGRHSKNLYPGIFSDDLLERNIEQLRDQLLIAEQIHKSTLTDRFSFLLWSLTSIGVFFLPYLFVATIIFTF